MIDRDDRAALGVLLTYAVLVVVLLVLLSVTLGLCVHLFHIMAGG